MSDQKLKLYFIPSLIAVLLNQEKAKGAPLSETEVVQIRDKATVIALPENEAAKMDEARGYVDIDAENVWREWQRIRAELSNRDTPE